jgi:predicted Zn finger-like uncharacterized protein
MPIRRCPACQAEAAVSLDHISKIPTAQHYRCRDCGHVWTVSGVKGAEDSGKGKRRD